MRTFVLVFGLVPCRIGGMERLIRETAIALDERGWRTVVVFLGEPPTEVRQYLDLPALAIEVIPKFDQSWWRALPALNGLLRRTDVECVNFHFTDFVDPIFLLAALHKTRCFVTVHNSMSENYEPHAAPAWKRAMARIVGLPVGRVFCVSRFVQDYVHATGYLPSDKLATVYNGVYIPEIQALPMLRSKYRLRHSILEHAPVILQVGQLINEKGVADLLEAAPAVLKHHRQTTFLFAGEGADEQRFRQRAAGLQIEHAVRWVGVDVDPCGNGLFAAADVLCAPSRWQEAFGLTIIEGMAHEVPVVATRTGGIGEIVVDGETGFLVDRRNAKQLAARINQLLADPELRKRMGRAGCKRANATFNLKTNVRQMLDLCGIPAVTPLAARAAVSTGSDLAPSGVPEVHFATAQPPRGDF